MRRMGYIWRNWDGWTPLTEAKRYCVLPRSVIPQTHKAHAHFSNHITEGQTIQATPLTPVRSAPPGCGCLCGFGPASGQSHTATLPESAPYTSRVDVLDADQRSDGRRSDSRCSLESTGLRTKKAAIEEALRALVRLRAQERVRTLRGKLQWQEDLSVQRQGRFLNLAR
jgi:hypothetical protein